MMVKCVIILSAIKTLLGRSNHGIQHYIPRSNQLPQHRANKNFTTLSKIFKMKKSKNLLMTKKGPLGGNVFSL